jgi:hypothetical protein
MRVAVLTVLAALVAGCGAADRPTAAPVAIRTLDRPYTVCDTAAIRGTLVADPTYGLALDTPGHREGTVWPYGYSARRESGTIVLVDSSGDVVAREGDDILAAGGFGDGYATVECWIRVNPSPTPGHT